MLTDNPVLIRKLTPLPALMCVQRRAAKTIPKEEDFIRSNIESFGNDIGQTTNRITAMFEVLSRFKPDSEEYRVVSYRIRCGQLFQQNAIDKAKGIVCKPMPREWYDKHAVNKIENQERRDFYRRIVADKKPYFMKYIYPMLMKQYNNYFKNTNRNALREFQMTVDELYRTPIEELTEQQKEFLKYYEYRMPVGTSDCVMNKICRRFENEFDGYIGKHNSTVKFDYTIMKSSVEYAPKQYSQIKKLYEDYNKRLISYSIFADYERVNESDSYMAFSMMNEEFLKECSKICPNRFALCNIVLDICYKTSSTKRFAWNMCGSEIIHNLLRRNGGRISYPVLDDNGSIEFKANKFSLKTKEIEYEVDE